MESVNEPVNPATAKGRRRSFMCRIDSPKKPIIRYNDGVEKAIEIVKTLVKGFNPLKSGH